MRWVLLDEIVKIEKKITAQTRSRVPRGPVSPELLMMEMMAQTGALLLGAEKNFEEDVVFAKIEGASFESGWESGDLIQIEAASDNLRPEGAWFEASIRQMRGAKVAQGRFLLMNVGHLLPNQTKPVTFHEAFMNHFRVRDKVR